MAEITSTIGKVGRAAPAPDAGKRAAAVAASIPQAIHPGFKPEEDAGLPIPPPEQDEKRPMEIATLRTLIELGRVRETIVLGGLEFEMETLGDDAQEGMFRSLAQMDSVGADAFINLRRVVVATAVVSVNGQPFESLDPAAHGSGVEKKISIAKRMQSQVIDRLYDFYNSLLEKSQQKIDPEQVKN
jgi:hypothetical protein